LIRREIPISRQQALTILETYFEEFRNIHITALDRFHQIILEDFRLRQGTVSGIIHDLIIDEVRMVFQGRKGFRIVEENNGFYIVINSALFVRFKRLNEFLLASNQLTERVQRFNRQMLIEDDIPLLRNVIPDEELVSPNFANLNVGYHLDETSSRIVRLFVVCPQGETRNRWEHCFYDESELVATVATIVSFESRTETQTPQPNVKLKDELSKDKDDETKS